MAFMYAVGVVETEYAALIRCLQMRQKESEVVLNHLSGSVNPDLLAKDADSAGASKTSLVIGLFTKITSSSHKRILAQVLLCEQHLLRSL